MTVLAPLLAVALLAQDPDPDPAHVAALARLVAYAPAAEAPADPDVVEAETVLLREVKRYANREGELTDRLDELVRAWRDAADPRLLPTAERPIRAADPLARVLAAYECHRLRDVPPGRVEPHPAAADFPGDVAAGAEPATVRVRVDTAVVGRHGTGCYAAPGATVVLRFPESVPGRDVTVRLGAHSDGIERRDAWRRMPQISRVFHVRAPVVETANAFGGLVYVQVGAGVDLGTIEVEIEGAVPAARFVLGHTEPEAWQRALRDAPAPWVELETSRVALTVRAADVAGLDDPTALLRLWDRVLDACAELASIPVERVRPERFVIDVDISAGWLHAGYPIMAHLAEAPILVGAERLARDGWGAFHELGHNHQNPSWTFQGTGEVTCNLFSMYVLEKVFEVRAPGGHDALSKSGAKLAAILGLGAKPWGLPSGDAGLDARAKEAGAGDPFVRLHLYRQVIDAFGWEPLRAAIAEYHGDAAPIRDDGAKRDTWLVRLSRQVGRDLGSFFQAWGVPTSEAARAELADLESWMPADWPAK